MKILRGDRDVAAARRFGRGMQRGERRREDDLDVGDVLHQGAELLDVLHGLRDRLVHLPVAGDEWSSHAIQNAECRMQTVPDTEPMLSRRAIHALSEFCILNSAFLFIRKHRHSRQHLAAEELERAPPPVEMCVMRSATPAFSIAAIESPPPTMVVPFTSATACATPIVPCANASISNTPIGPFQTTVFASRQRMRRRPTR